MKDHLQFHAMQLTNKKLLSGSGMKTLTIYISNSNNSNNRIKCTSDRPKCSRCNSRNSINNGARRDMCDFTTMRFLTALTAAIQVLINRLTASLLLKNKRKYRMIEESLSSKHFLFFRASVDIL